MSAKLADWILNNKTPCVTVRQPWAWAIMNGKDIENRQWTTPYRGPLLIHSGKTPSESYDRDCRWIKESCGMKVPVNLDYGAVIGLVRLNDVWHASEYGHSSDDRGEISYWSEPGCYHLMIDQPRLLPVPVPLSGDRKLFYPTRAALLQIAEELRKL